MGTLKPQPRTRQRALLKKWGVDESRVPENGIDNHGVWIIGKEQPNHSWLMDVVCVVAKSDDLLRTQYAFPSSSARAEMLEAMEFDWADYKKSLGIV